jgi:hypothetical protein
MVGFKSLSVTAAPPDADTGAIIPIASPNAPNGSEANSAKTIFASVLGNHG